MLRHRLDHTGSAADGEVSLGGCLEEIQVFLSHSKHDDSGESVVRSIRDWIHEHSPLASFLDVHDIPPGRPFGDLLLHQIGASGAVVAVRCIPIRTLRANGVGAKSSRQNVAWRR